MNKAKKINIPKILLVVILIGSLLGVHVMEVMAVAANEAIVEVSSYEELVAAIDAAQDGDFIGIKEVIYISGNAEIGHTEKHITLKRIDGGSAPCIEIIKPEMESTIKFQNMTFDGDNKSIESFIVAHGTAIFENMAFQNCISPYGGGAVQIRSGDVYFNNCMFDNNASSLGGHISMSYGNLISIKNSTFKNGYSTYNGGAIFIGSFDSNCIISNSVILENSAENMGGGIYSPGSLTLEESKIFNNTAVTGGSEIASFGTLTMEEDLEALQALYADENIIVKGWVSDYDESSGSYLKLAYEPMPTEVILAESSLGVAGDSKIISLDFDKFYKVITGEIVSYSKADGALTLEESEAGKLIGTEIIGLTNGVTYKVEEYTPVPSPEPPVDPGDNDNQDPDPTPTPEPEKPKPTPSPAPDKNDTTNNTTTNNDNSTVREDHSSTRNDYSGSNNTSTVHNYYTTEEAKASDESVVAVMAQPFPSPIYESVKSDITPVAPKMVEQEAKDDTDEAAASTPKNIRIEANGADVVFELNEDGYNISINANSNNQEVKADTPVTSSINWYEVAKIGLLAAITFTLLWKPRRTVKNDLI